MTGTDRWDRSATAARLGRAALVAAVVVFLAVWLWAWVALPPEGVVHHVGMAGPDGFGSRGGILVPLFVLGPVLLLGLRWLVVAMVRHGNGTGLSYPHKDYWLAPERREAFQHRVTGELDLVWCATVLLLTVGIVDIVRLTGDRGASSLMLPATGIYLAFVIWWTWWLVSRSRPPTT